MFNKKIGIIVVLSLLSFVSISDVGSQIYRECQKINFSVQDEEDPIEGPQGPPQAPINSFLTPFFIGAVLLGGYFFIVKNKSTLPN